MRWNSSNLITGMQSLFNSLSSNDSGRGQKALDSIRQAMLNALGPQAASSYPVVQLRVTYANEIQDLWYLRGDVMAALAALEGEAIARGKLVEISGMFKGLLPRSMSTRPSPLGN
jgi:hypothetical protein